MRDLSGYFVLLLVFFLLLPLQGWSAEPGTAEVVPGGATPAGPLDSAVSPAMTAVQVLELVEKRNIGQTSQAQMQMVIEAPGTAEKRRKMLMYRSRKDNDNQNLFIHFLSPADIINTTYLVLEENRDKKKWIYLSSFKKKRKIVSKDNSSSFVSSDFTYEDLETIHADEYDCSNLVEEMLEGRQVWHFTAVKKDQDSTAYSKSEMTVCRETHIPVQVRLFDKKGQHVKTLNASEIREVQSIQTPHLTVMEDHANGSRTTLRVDKVEYDLSLPSETFTPRNMEK